MTIFSRPFRQQLELIFSLAKRDLKAQYKESVLGFLWSLLKPAFLTLILWIVFARIVPIPFPHELAPYWLHVLISVLAWNYFIGSLFSATNSIIANGNLLTKVRLDAEVFPIASVLANAVHSALAFGLAVLVALLAVGLKPYVWLLPFILVIETILILGLAFYLSALNVLYRDVAGVLELVSMAWFYVTPIIYPLQVAQDKLAPKWFHLYMLNPIAPIIASIRRVLLYGRKAGEIDHQILLHYLGIATIVSLVLMVTGWLFFRWLSPRFADEL